MTETSALPLWPGWIKCAMADGYSLEIQDRRIVTEMEIGSQMRVEFDTDECVAECAVCLDPLAAAWLESFERDVLAQGSGWFLFPLWSGGGLEHRPARFRRRPQIIEKTGTRTVYQFTLDVGRRENLMPPRLCLLLMFIAPDFLIRLSEGIHYLTHSRGARITNTPANIWTAAKAGWEAAL